MSNQVKIYLKITDIIMLKDLTGWYPDVFTDIPRETDVI